MSGSRPQVRDIIETALRVGHQAGEQPTSLRSEQTRAVKRDVEAIVGAGQRDDPADMQALIDEALAIGEPAGELDSQTPSQNVNASTALEPLVESQQDASAAFQAVADAHRDMQHFEGDMQGPACDHQAQQAQPEVMAAATVVRASQASVDAREAARAGAQVGIACFGGTHDRLTAGNNGVQVVTRFAHVTCATQRRHAVAGYFDWGLMCQKAKFVRCTNLRLPVAVFGAAALFAPRPSSRNSIECSCVQMRPMS